MQARCSVVPLVVAVALALGPTAATAAPDRDRKVGTGLTVGGIAPLATGIGLLFATGDVERRTTRVGLYASGISTLALGVGMMGTGIGFFGRSNAARRAQPWPLGRGASVAYLSMSAMGLGLVALGSYARIFVEQGSRRARRLRGLGLAGIIVGGNLTVFGTFLGAYGLGQASYDGPTPQMRVGRHGGMLTWSGRF